MCGIPFLNWGVCVVEGDVLMRGRWCRRVRVAAAGGAAGLCTGRDKKEKRVVRRKREVGLYAGRGYCAVGSVSRLTMSVSSEFPPRSSYR